jgi:hypothetical protein
VDQIDLVVTPDGPPDPSSRRPRRSRWYVVGAVLVVAVAALAVVAGRGLVGSGSRSAQSLLVAPDGATNQLVERYQPDEWARTFVSLDPAEQADFIANGGFVAAAKLTWYDGTTGSGAVILAEFRDTGQASAMADRLHAAKLAHAYADTSEPAIDGASVLMLTANAPAGGLYREVIAARSHYFVYLLFFSAPSARTVADAVNRQLGMLA